MIVLKVLPNKHYPREWKSTDSITRLSKLYFPASYGGGQGGYGGQSYGGGGGGYGSSGYGESGGYGNYGMVII